jgi:hypothetical protein
MAISRTQDTDPSGRRVTTDPGLAPEPGLKKSTDPGLAPPSTPGARLEIRDATPPMDPPVALGSSHLALDASPELPPSAVRFGGDATPVPAELTDGLLNGLLASQNEAYFRRAKAASASSGEAAAAFHGEPHVVPQGSPTPAPEPPVLLRRSVEMDIAKTQEEPQANREPAAIPETELPTNPKQARIRESTPSDATVPLPAPRSRWIEKALAFAVAVMVVGIVGILLVRWLSDEPANRPLGNPALAHPPLATPATSAHAAATRAEAPVAAPAPADPAPVSPSAPAAQTQPPPTEALPVRPTGKGSPSRGDNSQAAPVRAPRPAPSPGEVLPREKDDVKRSM